MRLKKKLNLYQIYVLYRGVNRERPDHNLSVLLDRIVELVYTIQEFERNHDADYNRIRFLGDGKLELIVKNEGERRKNTKKY